MGESVDEVIIIRPGEPGYEEHAPKVDPLGGTPMPLVAVLRFAESELFRFTEMKKMGFCYTTAGLADGSSDDFKARPIDERISELEKMLSDTKAVVAWAEAKRPGSSKNENGSLLLMEYEKETGKKV